MYIYLLGGNLKILSKRIEYGLVLSYIKFVLKWLILIYDILVYILDK